MRATGHEYSFLVKETKRRDNFGEVGVESRKILKGILEMWCAKFGQTRDRAYSRAVVNSVMIIQGLF
jgi:hypothetical protein